MSMCHKAYVLDYEGFAVELRPLLEKSLESNEVLGLIAFVDAQKEHLTWPWEATQLPHTWKDDLEQSDVQEVGDIALTKYYGADDDCGIQEHWRDVHERLPVDAQQALLGEQLGRSGAVFDPGRMGSYFQCPAVVRQSASILNQVAWPELTSFRELLSQAAAGGKGLYVTF